MGKTNSRMRILFVDDAESWRKQLPRFLEREYDQWNVETASSVEQALGMIRETPFDVVVATYEMQGRDGLDLLDTLRDQGNDTPFILFPSKRQEKVAMRALNLGADGYVHKGEVEIQSKQLAQILARNLSKWKEAEEKIETLHQWANQLNRAEDMEEILEYTLNGMEQTLGFTFADVSMRKGDLLEVKAIRGYSSLPQELRQLPLDGPGITVKVVNTGKSIRVNDVRDYPAYLPTKSTFKAELAVPITIDEKVIGVLNAEAEKTNAFTQQDVRLMETLASHVAVAISELREKKKRVSLQRLDELRTQFLTMAAHEINTPLTPIKTRLEMLLKGYQGELKANQGKTIERLLGSVNRLERLVDDFRQVSQLQRKDITLEKRKHDLATTIDEVLAKYKATLVEEDIHLEETIQRPLKAIYDHKQMVELISNLMENAIDYTDDQIWIQGGKDEGEYAYLSVRDNGPGIPHDEQEKIFQPFYRVEDSRERKNRRFGGSGLGLSICERIVAAHGGNIHVKSQPDEGTTFTVRFPAHEEQNTL